MSVPDVVRHGAAEVTFETYDTLGFNYRLTDLQAAVGRVQLQRLPEILERRRRLASRYATLLASVPGLRLPEEPVWARTNWQSYCVRLPDGCDQRAVMQSLLDQGIASKRGVMCTHRSPAYMAIPWSCDGLARSCSCAPGVCLRLSESEQAEDRSLMLPLYPGLSDADQDRVVAAVADACGRRAPRHESSARPAGTPKAAWAKVALAHVGPLSRVWLAARPEFNLPPAARPDKTNMMKVINVVGARPNFMKMAPIIEAMNRYPDRFQHMLVHTGQHYDERMSKSFFVDLGMPKPDMDLEVGSGSHAEQTARIMVEFEKVCLREKPDLVIVVGDVNSTMACTITAKKLGIRVAHVEAGLRSRDMAMPEEINRLCTDVLCDYLFTTDHFANENLRAEGISPDKIFFVGNVMIDTLLKHKEMARGLGLADRWGLERGRYATLTLHRPSNVDDRETLEGILQALADIAREIPIVFPIHPRTRRRWSSSSGSAGTVRPRRSPRACG